MLAMLAPLIARGVVDNTTRGRIVLQLWGIDGGEPIELAMEGNCLRDIAGCRVSFTNLAAAAEQQEEHPVLARLRAPLPALTAGDMTLSRRLPEEDNRRMTGNALSLEFFVGAEHRILIETAAFSYDISLPQWTMSWEEENAQQFLNMEALRAHVDYNTEHFCGPALAEMRESGFPPCIWDTRLNHAEARMAIYASIRTKYLYEKGGELSEAYVMGRTDILSRKAAEDEAHLPPEPGSERREWEILDFVEPQYAKEVRRAMRHPLFYATSQLTAIVQEQLLQQGKRGPAEREAAEHFINRYAALVSQLLATILLTRQKQYPQDLATRRLHHLSERLKNLTAPEADRFSADTLALIREASGALLNKLETFAAGLNHS